MKTFGQDVKQSSSFSSEKINALRVSLIKEELDELMEAMRSNSSMKLSVRNLLRVASGELDLSSKVHHIRTYSMKRDHLPQALEMFKEIEKIKDENTKVAAIVPSVSADMSLLHALYQNNSLEEADNAMDEVGMSEAFQKLVIRASQLGTVEKSTITVIA